MTANHPFRPLTGAPVRAAFTLTELMVSMVLLSFVCLILFGVFSHVASSYQQMEGRADSFRDGRAAAHLLTTELGTMVGRGAYTPAFAGFTVLNSGGTNASLAFLARLPRSAQPADDAASDVCTVTYFVASDTHAGQSARILYRGLIPSRETYRRLEDAGDLADVGDFDASLPLVEPVANHIVDFRIRVLDPEFQEVDANSADAAHVEIDFAVIGARGGEIFFDTNTPEDAREAIRLKNARRFTLRSRIP